MSFADQLLATGSGKLVREERKITRRYKFSAAHFLPGVPDGHKCKREHGHNYKFDITIGSRQGNALSPEGFLIDFWDLDKIVAPVLATIDHHKLNDIDGLENPTAEIIAEWIFNEVDRRLESGWLYLDVVTVFEEEDCWASYSRTET